MKDRHRAWGYKTGKLSPERGSILLWDYLLHSKTLELLLVLEAELIIIHFEVAWDLKLYVLHLFNLDLSEQCTNQPSLPWISHVIEVTLPEIMHGFNLIYSFTPWPKSNSCAYVCYGNKAENRKEVESNLIKQISTINTGSSLCVLLDNPVLYYLGSVRESDFIPVELC